MNRRFLAAFKAAASAVIVAASLTSAAGSAHANPQVTQNGYPVLSLEQTECWSVGDGQNNRFCTRPGETTRIFREIAQWWNDNIEPVDNGSVPLSDNLIKPGSDDYSWGPPMLIPPSNAELSNHGSGTGMDLNSTLHPLGARTLTADQHAAITAKVAEISGGAARWGGSYTSGDLDEMHFEIVAPGL